MVDNGSIVVGNGNIVLDNGKKTWLRINKNRDWGVSVFDGGIP